MITDKQPEYGRSPAMQALEAIKIYNNLSPEERARISAAFVREKLARGEWPDEANLHCASK